MGGALDSTVPTGELRGTARFEVRRRLGEGAMGVVYEAFDRERGARIAIKTLRHGSADGLLRFKNEFRALQDLEHPNLVSLGELLEVDGQWLFTMQLVEGTDFLTYVTGGEAAPALAEAPTERVRKSEPPAPAGAPARGSAPRARFDEVRLRACLGQLAAGLNVLHAAGKVHRDVKPSNIQVTPSGQVVLLDFGLVTDSALAAQSSDGTVVGTAAYMAPEQAASKPVGPEADWYSAGVLLYEVLTGRLPYVGSTLEILMDKQRFEPPAPRTLAPDVPEDLDALCVALLRFDPALRDAGRRLFSRLFPEAGSRPLPMSTAVSHGPPFVGRRAELAQLRGAFDEVRAGRSLRVLVEGDSGVGKSALVRAFTDGLAPHGAVVLAGRCYERESVPYKGIDGVVDSLSRYLSHLAHEEAAELVPLNAAWLVQVFPVLRRVRALARAPRPHHDIVDPLELRTQVFAALRELSHRLALRRPLVLAIDDLQWADADSLALVNALMRPPNPPPLMLIGTARFGWLESIKVPGDLHRLALAPLPPGDASELAGALLARMHGAAPEAADSEAIAKEAGGHPLFIDELVRHSAAATPGDGPVHLDDAIWKRVERLEAKARELIHVIAIAGSPLPIEVAAQAANLQLAEFSRRASGLRLATLARNAGAPGQSTIEPYHDRVREAILSRLDEPARRRGHEAIALALEAASTPDHQALATHWRGAGEPERAARHALSAAAGAEAALAFDRAARFYQLVLDLGRLGTAEASAIRGKMGDALSCAGRGKEAAAAYLAAVPGASTAEKVQLQRKASEGLLRSGHVQEGLAALRAVLEAVDLRLPASPRQALLALLRSRIELRVRGLGFTARDGSQIAAEDLTRIDVCWGAAASLSMVDHLCGAAFQTRSLLLALRAGDPIRIARAIAVEAIYQSTTGKRALRRSAIFGRRAKELAAELDTPHALGFVHGYESVSAFQAGRYRETVEAGARAVELFERCTAAAWEIRTMQLFSLWSLYCLGELEELCKRVPAQLQEADARGDLYYRTSLQTTLCNAVWLVVDEPAEALRRTAETIRHWPSERFLLQHYWDLIARSQIDLYCGDGAAAWARIRDHEPALRASLQLRIDTVRIEFTTFRGRTALAAAPRSPSERARLHRQVERDARTLERHDAAFTFGPAWLLRAGLAAQRGEDAAAAEHLRAAIRAFDEADLALCAAVARRRLGELLGGDEGAGLQRGADAFMRGQRILRPERFVAMIAPGFR